MKHVFWKPAVLALGILIVITASGFLLRGNTGSEKPAASKPEDQGTAIGQGARADQPTKSGGANADQRRQLLETVGVLTAAHCYQTYFNLGLVADGKEKGAYTGKDAYKLLDSVLSLLDSVDQKLAALTRIDLDKEDRDSLEQMRVLSSLLRQQGKELANFWDSGKDEDAARYESIRKDAWAAISRLTGAGR